MKEISNGNKVADGLRDGDDVLEGVGDLEGALQGDDLVAALTRKLLGMG